MKPRRSKIILVGGAAALLFGILYVRSHPLVFNESLWHHAHCMAQAGLSLRLYANDHEGQFPYHTNGYGDALLLMTPEQPWFYYLTGPGYDTSAFAEALIQTADVDEKRCGRVYVQGLTDTNDARIAILFDKIAAPPDHCHFPRRLWSPFVREVCFVDGSWQSVRVERWPAFAEAQVKLLIEAGFARKEAAGLYGQVR